MNENKNDKKSEIIKKQHGVDDPLFANLKTPKSVMQEKWNITKQINEMPDDKKLLS